MNAPARFTDTAAPPPVFDAPARARFCAHYPERAHILAHSLTSHPLLEIEALAQLAGMLPVKSVEYNRGDLPIGVEGKPGSNGLTIVETIRKVAEAQSWAVLKNIEQIPAYEALLMDLLGEIRPEIEAATGAMLAPQGFIFVSSPNSVTPYHFDPEHNILLQIRGTKVMTQFPAGDTRFVPDEAHETYHSGGPRELRWDDAMLPHGTEFPLSPGEALFVPVMAPHFVKNGPSPSVSLSITWRSEWSYRESDARIMNAILRERGFKPASPGRWPRQNYAKAYAYRAMRKLGLTGS
ncbi:cupin-like domain-containing protein [Erythrobacter dokdonensis]|uniref:Transcription factor jumonji, jmjC n=1 Tax=Erythrobacter dokdonensis DSW-74 TaxID=1300349 RepID=A0A1A7BJX1_9SPHN|nr:cupin-like domain-containing protein [Erythrobacter dokdonensis]OBV11480.1 Transcription factor jumonji, jmjC [Erythrobacter dokdonensis DSW-74]